MVAPTALEKTGFNITALRASKNNSYYYQVCFVGTPQNPTVVETGKIENQARNRSLVVTPYFEFQAQPQCSKSLTGFDLIYQIFPVVPSVQTS